MEKSETPHATTRTSRRAVERSQSEAQRQEYENTMWASAQLQRTILCSRYCTVLYGDGPLHTSQESLRTSPQI